MIRVWSIVFWTRQQPFVFSSFSILGDVKGHVADGDDDPWGFQSFVGLMSLLFLVAL